MGAMTSQIISFGIAYSNRLFPAQKASNAENVSILWRHPEELKRW